MSIPVRNVYHMLCYVLGGLGERELVQAGGEESPDKFDLLGLVLADSCRRLLKRGLDRSYREFSEPTRSPRGKLDLATTAKRCLRRSVRVQCEFEDLSYNVLHNQILRSSLARLIRTKDLEPDTISQLRDVRSRMTTGMEVDELRLERSHFLRVQLHPNNARYRFPLKICELVYGNLLPLKDGKGYAFRPFSEKDMRLHALFEDFVRAFYAEKFEGVYRVKKEGIRWESEFFGETNRLPSMEADLILRDRQNIPRFVIDTKYYRAPMISRHEGSDQKYISTNLYQVLAYLQNLYLVENLQEKPAGMLLYAHPGLDKEFVPGNYKLCGFPFRMEAVDLSKPWQEIEEDLLALIPQESATAV